MMLDERKVPTEDVGNSSVFIDGILSGNRKESLATYAKLPLANLARFARNCAGYSQEGLAKRLDVSQSRISQIESGVYDTSLSQITDLALVCGGNLSLTFEHPEVPDKLLINLTPDSIKELLLVR